MDVGLYFDFRNPPDWRREWARHYAESLDLASYADQLGISQIWLSEHHFFEDGYLPQPLTLAAAMAVRTKNARIGTAVLLAALRPSLLIAEEAAVVDILSGGRLDLGIGAGYRIPEFSAFGTDISKRYELVEERVIEIREWWLGGRLTPPPIQRPIPIWGGFFGPRGAALAGRLNVGLLAANHDLLVHYQNGLRDGGHDPSSARMRVNVEIVLSDDPERT
jgi:alkanesulfonate monooxygenase SsuD/methylene tetrahydromethanopterin reductase-like flavin-dependent oxidoreductase (luciferase family)